MQRSVAERKSLSCQASVNGDVVNLVLSQVYHTDRPPYLFAAERWTQAYLSVKE